jgi:hypothetical protein
VGAVKDERMSRTPTTTSDFEREKWQAAYDLELKKWDAERSVRERETVIKERDQNLRDEEIAIKREEVQLSRWTNPLALAIFGASFAGLVNAGLNWLNTRYQFDLEDERSKKTLVLEQSKSEAARILEMIKAPNKNQAAENLLFLVDTGLISDQSLVSQIRNFLAARKEGTGPLLSSGERKPGEMAYSGSCQNKTRIVCYFDQNGLASNCASMPC